jgi:hypothetical protein
MKREGVIISSFTIERPNQIQLFQVRIPREAKNIIGVEMGMRWLNGAFPTPIPSSPAPPATPAWPPLFPVGGTPFLFKRNQLVGELKLQSYEKANIFYTTELLIDQNIGINNFTSSFFPAKVYSHQTVMNEEVVNVGGDTTLVQGVFRNKFDIVGAFQYKVFVYVWVEAKEDQSNL